jgi:hypothetical protein
MSGRERGIEREGVQYRDRASLFHEERNQRESEM